MVASDRRRWNRKYRERGMTAEPVAAIVAEYCHLAPPGRALDIAAGTGQNARYLAEKGFSVTAVDISDEALGLLAGAHPHLYPLCVDLDRWKPPEDRFQLVVNLRYLNRRLYGPIQKALTRGGVLIFETFIDPPPGRSGATHCPDYLLGENELQNAFSAMDIVHYEETLHHCSQGDGRMASLVAIKP